MLIGVAVERTDWPGHPVGCLFDGHCICLVAVLPGGHRQLPFRHPLQGTTTLIITLGALFAAGHAGNGPGDGRVGGGRGYGHPGGARILFFAGGMADGPAMDTGAGPHVNAYCFNLIDEPCLNPAPGQKPDSMGSGPDFLSLRHRGRTRRGEGKSSRFQEPAVNWALNKKVNCHVLFTKDRRLACCRCYLVFCDWQAR